MTTPIPAMQAAATALEAALPLAKEEWTVRADWNTAGMAAIAKMEAAVSLLRVALDAGEPQPVAVRYKNNEGRWRYLNWPFTKGWTFPPGLGKLHNLYDSPVAAAPQGGAMPAPVQEMSPSQQRALERQRRLVATLPQTREQYEALRGSLRKEGTDGERGAVSPSCAATDQPVQQEKKHG